jgi:uncharacterized iron-regulated membrane protein
VSWSRIHRWLAIVLVVPLVIWSITGVLFHLKPGWSRAYDMLSIDRPLDALPANPPDAIATAAGGTIIHLELTNTALGPLYRVATTAGTVLLDASLHRRSPLSLEDARTLAADAVAHSPHAADYGTLRDARIDRNTVRLAFEHANVDIDRDSALLVQRGRDTDRIDWLYRLHYLSWTGNRTLDKLLAIVGLALIWVVMIPGLVLFVRRRGRPRSE